MIELRGVVKSYGASRAVDGIDLEIGKGEFCVLIGPSGCGKSTLLRTVNRMVEPDKGEVFVDGRPVRERSGEELRRGIGYVIQSVGLFPHMTVGDNVAVVPRLLGWKEPETRRRVEEMLELVGLSGGWGSRWPRELSGGEAQRVGVARALAADPPILLMDEPFGSVDPLTRVRLQREFLAIQRSLHKTVLFVTHDVEEAIRLADRVALMRSGRILRYDTPEGFLSAGDGDFETDFLGLEYGLEILSRHTVREALNRLSRKTMLRGVEPRAHEEDSDRTAFPGFVSEPSPERGIPAIREGDNLKEALGLMIARRVECIEVADARGCPIGTIRLGDVLGALKPCEGADT